MARRQNGQGTVERLSSGRYRFRIALPDGKRKWSPTFETEKEALEMLQASLSVLKNIPQVKITPTLRVWGEQWLGRRRNRNMDSDRSNWKNHVETALFIDSPISQINRIDIRNWLRELERKPALVPAVGGGFQRADWSISSNVQRKALNLLRCALSDAIEDELIKTNPADGLKIETDPDLEDQWTYLTEDEIAQLLHCQQIDKNKRLIYQFAIYTGLRQGEIFGLRWDDVYIEKTNAPHIIVRRSFSGPTKNKKHRKVPLVERALSALVEFRDRNPQSTEIVFCKPDGEMYSVGYDNGWSDRKNKGRHQAGHKTLAKIDRDVRFHDLRHTTASHLIMGSWGTPWSIYEVKNLLGHSSVTVTQRYAHLSHEYLQNKASVTALDCGPNLVHARFTNEGLGHNPEMGVTGVEPVTFGFGVQENSPKKQGLTLIKSVQTVQDPVQTLKNVSIDVLKLVANKTPVPAGLLRELTNAALCHPFVQMIGKLQQGGDFVLDVACELAAHVISDCDLLTNKHMEGTQNGK